MRIVRMGGTPVGQRVLIALGMCGLTILTLKKYISFKSKRRRAVEAYIVEILRSKEAVSLRRGSNTMSDKFVLCLEKGYTSKILATFPSQTKMSKSEIRRLVCQIEGRLMAEYGYAESK